MKRPVFLTIWLVLLTLGALFSLYSYTFGSSMMATAMPSLPVWAPAVYDVLTAVQLIGVVLLWMWKRLGFYLVIAVGAVVAVLNFVLLGALGIGALVATVIGVGVLYLAMRPVWTQFA